MFSFKKSYSGRAIATRALVQVVVCTFLCGMGLFLMSAKQEAAWDRPTTGDDVMSIREHAPGSPAAVLARMGDKCWTGEAPADMEGKMPGHVVFRNGGTEPVRIGGPVVVGKALSQIFENKDFGLDVFAFCR